MNPLALPNPNRWKDTGVALLVTAQRTDVPLRQMTNEHQTFRELGHDALLSSSESQHSIISILPGQRQSFSFGTDFPLPSGKFEVWCSFRVRLFDTQGRELIFGEIVSTRFPLRR
jgi:hypothetical protein